MTSMSEQQENRRKYKLPKSAIAGFAVLLIVFLVYAFTRNDFTRSLLDIAIPFPMLLLTAEYSAELVKRVKNGEMRRKGDWLYEIAFLLTMAVVIVCAIIWMVAPAIRNILSI